MISYLFTFLGLVWFFIGNLTIYIDSFFAGGIMCVMGGIIIIGSLMMLQSEKALKDLLKEAKTK